MEISNDKSTKKLWNFVSKNAGWNTNNSPSSINDNGVLVREKLRIANIFNSYYRNKVIDILSSIDEDDGDPMHVLTSRMREWVGSDNYTRKLVLKEISLTQLEKLSMKMSNSTANGLDNISNYFIKEGFNIIGPNF